MSISFVEWYCSNEVFERDKETLKAGTQRARGDAVGLVNAACDGSDGSLLILRELAECLELVVDGMMFRALEEVAHPTRRAEIAVVEVLAEDGEDVVPGCSRYGRTERREHQRADDHRVGGDFQRMFVEGG